MDALAWGEWRPDISSYDGSSSELINNVLPRGDGYGPVLSQAAFTGALPAACRGAFLAFNNDGTAAIFAGTATKLFRLDNSSLAWFDVSKADSSTVLTSVTEIGDATGGGGLAAAFDGNANQAIAACASKATTTSTYAGLNFTTALSITSATVYGSNDQGFISGSNPSVTITIYGKTTAPANATDGTSLGAVTFTDTANESAGRAIASTNTQLWNYVWATVSTASSSTIAIAEVKLFGTKSYNLASTDQWQFAQSTTGVNPDIVAVNANDNPQRYTLNSSQNFADLAGSPPMAAYCAMVNEYLVLTGINGHGYRIEWSATGDITGWTPGTNGCDLQDFPDGGLCRGVAGGEFGWIFQDNCIRQMQFVGGTTQFQFTRITEDMGLRTPYSIVRAADRVYFLARSGFQELTDTGVITPVGKERFDRFFYTNWDSGSPSVLCGVHDPESSRVWWFYKSNTGMAGFFDSAIVYDWQLQRAVPVSGITGEFAFPLAQPGITLESLATLGFTNIETIPFSFDSIVATLATKLGIFDQNNIFGFLSGQTLEATLITAKSGGLQRTFVRSARPVTDAPTVFGNVGYAQKLSDMETFSTENSMNSTGFTPHRVDGRIIRYRNRIPAGTSWTYSVGVEPDTVPSGMK